jgi:hypothetical protein
VVYVSGSSVISKIKNTELIDSLNTANIPVYFLDEIKKIPGPKEFNFPVVIRFRAIINSTEEPNRVAKIVQIVNSQPIDLTTRYNETM